MSRLPGLDELVGSGAYPGTHARGVAAALEACKKLIRHIAFYLHGRWGHSHYGGARRQYGARRVSQRLAATRAHLRRAVIAQSGGEDVGQNTHATLAVAKATGESVNPTSAEQPGSAAAGRGRAWNGREPQALLQAAFPKETIMSVGTLLLIILVIALLGGFSGWGGGPFYGTGYYGGGGIGLLLIIVLVLVLSGRI